MTARRFFVFAPAMIACFAPAARVEPQPAGPSGFIALFNGRDLSGWKPATHWAVQDGIIVLNDRTDRQKHSVFLRTSNLADPVQTGIEIQVAARAPGRRLGKGSAGGIYDLVAPTRPLKDFARQGYLGLQDHGTPVWYRNIRIRPLE